MAGILAQLFTFLYIHLAIKYKPNIFSTQLLMIGQRESITKMTISKVTNVIWIGYFLNIFDHYFSNSQFGEFDK